MDVLLQSCLSADFDAATGVCAHPIWLVQDSGGLPPLSITDASALGTAIIAVWALGFGFKLVRRFIMR